MCLLYAFSSKQFEIRTVEIPIACIFLSIFCFFLLIPQVVQVTNIFWIVSILEVSQNMYIFIVSKKLVDKQQFHVVMFEIHWYTNTFYTL